MTVFNAQGASVGSSEFVRARIGHCTASRVKDVLGIGGPAKREKYLHDIVAERLIDAATDHYVSADMEWGLLTEPEAKHEYAKRTGLKLRDTEFTLHPKIEFFGATPDSLIGESGLAEFKCPRTANFIRWKLSDEIPKEHKPQMIAQLLCTGREWCDFVAYDPRIRKADARMFVLRFVPTDKEMLAVETAVKEFLAEVEQMFVRASLEEAA